jgi:hypothetical protein
MSDNRIVVNLQNPATESAPPNAAPGFSNTPAQSPKKKGGCGKILLILGVLLLLVLMGAGIYGYFWYSSLYKSPAYSLASLIDAARKDDQPKVETYLDTNAVIDDFVPQVEQKATERYGRNFPPEVVKRAKDMLQPLLPAVKERARTEIPRIIKEKSQIAPQVSPFWMSIGIGRVVNISEAGDEATVTSDLQNRPFELKMRRSGDKWQVVALKDDLLADKIANEIAQRLLQEAAKKPGKPGAGKNTIEDIKRQIEQLTLP